MTAVELITPATAPSSAIIMGAFDNRLFEHSEFPIVAHNYEQRRESAVGGSLFFGYFLLAKQKKVTRKSRESDTSQINPYLYSYHSSSASAVHSNH
jgi:hypothetical protein